MEQSKTFYDGGMTLAQVHELEPLFAEFKGELGWVLPKWLVVLKLDIIERDIRNENIQSIKTGSDFA